MPVPSVMTDLSASAASNSPGGSEAVGNNLDNYLRAIQAIIRSTNHKSADLASAASVAIGAAAGEFMTITGTTTITSFDNVSAGIVRTLIFSGALQLTHSSNLQLPGSANYTTTAGDVLTFVSLGSGQWKCVSMVAARFATSQNVYDSGIKALVTTNVLPGMFRSARYRGSTATVDAQYGLPSSISRSAAGVYTITHNFGLGDTRNISAFASITGATPGVATVDSYTSNDFVVRTFDLTGAATDYDFSIFVFRIGS